MRRTPAYIRSSQDKSDAVKGTIIGEREASVTTATRLSQQRCGE